MSEITNEKIMEEIQYIEKAIKASEEYRQVAITQKAMYEQQIKEKDEELAKLGTTAADAKKEIEDIDRQIIENIEKLKTMIPFELLKKKGKI